MALTDIVASDANSAAAARGDSGVVGDILNSHMSNWVSPTYDGGYWSVSGVFKNSADANLPDGTVVCAYHATTHLLVGTGTTTAGSVTIIVSTNASVYLVADPAGLAGETVCTTALTPVVG